MSQIRPKSILGTALVAFLALFLTSCEGGEDVLPDGFSFSFSPKEVTIPATGGSASVSFEAPFAWSASTTADWIQFSPKSGNPGKVTLEITLGVNPARESRSATVTVSLPDWNYSETVSVVQRAHDPSITLSEQALAPGAEETATAQFTVSSTVDWTASADVPWISFSPENGGFGDTVVNVTVAANPVAQERTGVITVEGEDQKATYTVTQAAADQTLNLSAEAVNAPAEGAATTITVSTTLDWTAEPSDDWISVEPVSGTYGESAVVVKVAANEIARSRSGSVRFAAGDRSVELPVNQEAAAPWIEVSVPDATVGSSAGSVNLTVTSNADWTAAEQADWMSVSPAGNFGNTDITVTYGANPVVVAREAVVTFTAGTATATYTLKQEAAAPVLNVSPTEAIQAPAERTAFEFKLFTTLTEWTVTSSVEWITVAPATGSYGDTDVIATVDVNTVAREREGVITFVGGEFTITVPVKQAAAAAWIQLSAAEAEFSSAKGSLVLTVTSNADWTVSAEADWAGLSVMEGEPGETKVTVSVPTNDSPDARNTTITFVAVNELAVFNLSQKGREEMGGITGDIGDWGDGGEGDYGRK